MIDLPQHCGLRIVGVTRPGKLHRGAELAVLSAVPGGKLPITARRPPGPEKLLLGMIDSYMVTGRQPAALATMRRK